MPYYQYPLAPASGYGLVHQPSPCAVSAFGQEPSASQRAEAWLWTDRTSFEKAAVVASGLSLGGLLVYALAVLAFPASPSPYTPNLKRARSRKARSRAPAGKIITVSGGRRFGHRAPPKKYRIDGARQPSDYAWPAGYKYPLVFRTAAGQIKPTLSRKRIRAAASYFGKNKHLYPIAVRRVISGNINKAKKRFGIGGIAATP